MYGLAREMPDVSRRAISCERERGKGEEECTRVRARSCGAATAHSARAATRAALPRARVCSERPLSTHLVLRAVLAVDKVLVLLEADHAPDDDLRLVDRHAAIGIVEHNLDKGREDVGAGALVEEELAVLGAEGQVGRVEHELDCCEERRRARGAFVGWELLEARAAALATHQQKSWTCRSRWRLRARWRAKRFESGGARVSGAREGEKEWRARVALLAALRSPTTQLCSGEKLSRMMRSL